MLSIHKVNPMVRAVGTMGVVATLVGAITYAQVQTNSVVLAANEMDVTGNVLRIWNGSDWATSAPGFSNSNLTVNTEGPKNEFFLQNLENTDLALSAQVTFSTTPNNIDPSKVTVNFYNDDSSTSCLQTTLFALEQNAVPFSNSDCNLGAGNQGSTGNAQNGNYYYSLTVQPGAVNGSSASIASFDLSFFGTEVVPPAP